MGEIKQTKFSMAYGPFQNPFKIKPMFNKNFYPTPPALINTMLQEVPEIANKVFLEPSSGKGDIISALIKRGAKNVDFCEIEPQLSVLSKSSGGRKLKSDFLQIGASEVPHVNGIIMNPPFTNQFEHINHAWKVAPSGCTIVALFSDDQTRNTRHKRIFKVNCRDYGTVTSLGQPFLNSERKTAVSVSMVVLSKPPKEGDDWSEYFDMTPEMEARMEGVQRYNPVRALVSEYLNEMDKYDKFIQMAGELGFSEFTIKSINYFDVSSKDKNRETYNSVKLKAYWKKAFSLMNADKYMNSSLSKKLNQFVEQNENVPFKMKNIFKMLEVVAGTHESRIKDLLQQTFDTLTANHKGNRFNLEGWKTNKSYMLGMKIIAPRVCYVDWNEVKINGYDDTIIDDLHKCLIHVTGRYRDLIETSENYGDRFLTLYRWYEYKYNPETKKLGDRDYKETGKWYEFGAFDVKFFKKGTCHLKFRNKDDWKMLNEAVARNNGGFAIPDFAWRGRK